MVTVSLDKRAESEEEENHVSKTKKSNSIIEY
jgi:hypothetical protein